MTRSEPFDALMIGRVPSRTAARNSANARIRAAAGAIADAMVGAIASFRKWRQVSRSRRELATLDDYQLRDIGLSRSQAMFESGKFFLQS